MNKQLTLIGIVTLNAAVVVAFIGCRSTSGMEGEPSRGAVVSYGGGMPDAGNSPFSGPRRVTVSQSAPPPAAVPTRGPSPVVEEPANPPGAEPVETPAAEPAGKTSAPKAVAQPVETPSSEEPSAVGAGRTYVVKNGDSLWVIARREHVTIDELTSANGLKRNATLRAGQKLVIPASSGKKSASSNVGSSSGESHKASHAASGDTYTVVSGDAMSTVARKLHTTTAALRAANPQVKNDNIRVGQKLNVPNGSKAPAAGAAKPAATKSSGAAPAATPAAKPASNGGLDLPEVAPLGGAPAAPAPEAAPAAVPSAAPAPEAVTVTPVSH